MGIWVMNTLPLVFLGHLSRLELLRHEGREVYIPRVVAKEIAENLMQPRRLSRLSVQHG